MVPFLANPGETPKAHTGSGLVLGVDPCTLRGAEACPNNPWTSCCFCSHPFFFGGGVPLFSTNQAKTDILIQTYIYIYTYFCWGPNSSLDLRTVIVMEPRHGPCLQVRWSEHWVNLHPPAPPSPPEKGKRRVNGANLQRMMLSHTILGMLATFHHLAESPGECSAKSVGSPAM